MRASATRSRASKSGTFWPILWPMNDHRPWWWALTMRKLVSRLGLEPRTLALKERSVEIGIE